jgi:hypothetical protein
MRNNVGTKDLPGEDWRSKAEAKGERHTEDPVAIALERARGRAGFAADLKQKRSAPWPRHNAGRGAGHRCVGRGLPGVRQGVASENAPPNGGSRRAAAATRIMIYGPSNRSSARTTNTNSA